MGDGMDSSARRSAENGCNAGGGGFFVPRGNGEMIALLRRFGADTSLKIESGVSPVSLARTIGNYNVRQFFADLDRDVGR